MIPALALLIFLLLVTAEGVRLGVAGALGAAAGVVLLIVWLERRRA